MRLRRRGRLVAGCRVLVLGDFGERRGAYLTRTKQPPETHASATSTQRATGTDGFRIRDGRCGRDGLDVQTVSAAGDEAGMAGMAGMAASRTKDEAAGGDTASHNTCTPKKNCTSVAHKYLPQTGLHLRRREGKVHGQCRQTAGKPSLKRTRRKRRHRNSFDARGRRAYRCTQSPDGIGAQIALLQQPPAQPRRAVVYPLGAPIILVGGGITPPIPKARRGQGLGIPPSERPAQLIFQRPARWFQRLCVHACVLEREAESVLGYSSVPGRVSKALPKQSSSRRREPRNLRKNLEGVTRRG